MLAFGSANGTLACRFVLSEDDEPRWKQVSRLTALPFVAAGHEHQDLTRPTWSNATIDRREVQARAVSSHHAHTVPADADQEVSARPANMLQARGLSVEAIAYRQIARLERELTEALDNIGAGYEQVGKAGRRGIERDILRALTK